MGTGPQGQYSAIIVLSTNLGYKTREPGKAQGRDRVGIVEGHVGITPVGSVFGQNSFYQETLGKRRGVASG